MAIAGNLPEWNWYNFSTAFTAVECFDTIVGWALAGLVLGKVAPAE